MTKIAVFAVTLTIMVFISMVNAQLTCYNGARVSQGGNDVTNTLTESIQCSKSDYLCLRSVTTTTAAGRPDKRGVQPVHCTGARESRGGPRIIMNVKVHN